MEISALYELYLKYPHVFTDSRQVRVMIDDGQSTADDKQLCQSCIAHRPSSLGPPPVFSSRLLLTLFMLGAPVAFRTELFQRQSLVLAGLPVYFLWTRGSYLREATL